MLLLEGYRAEIAKRLMQTLAAGTEQVLDTHPINPKGNANPSDSAKPLQFGGWPMLALETALKLPALVVFIACPRHLQVLSKS